MEIREQDIEYYFATLIRWLLTDLYYLHKTYKSVYLSIRTIKGPSFGAIISHPSRPSHPSFGISSLNVFFLPSDPPPSIFLFIMNLANHGLEIVVILFTALINRVLSLILPATVLVFLLYILLRDDALLDLLVFKCHFLNVLTHLVDPSF